MEYINMSRENIEGENLCCALASKKDQRGVQLKKELILNQGHTFRKLDLRSKVFIEYVEIERALVAVEGENIYFIYCLWVAGSHKGQGHGRALMDYLLEDAKKEGKNGIAVLSSLKKKPYLSDRSFLEKYGFRIVDQISDYVLMYLELKEGPAPSFTERSRSMKNSQKGFTIYSSKQCPFIDRANEELKELFKERGIEAEFIEVGTRQEALELDSFFNNYAIFFRGEFLDNKIYNRKAMEKFLDLAIGKFNR